MTEKHKLEHPSGRGYAITMCLGFFLSSDLVLGFAQICFTNVERENNVPFSHYLELYSYIIS